MKLKYVKPVLEVVDISNNATISTCTSLGETDTDTGVFTTVESCEFPVEPGDNYCYYGANGTTMYS